MTLLTLEVEAGPGYDVRDIIQEMCLVAARTGCLVITNLNSVRTMAKPGADPRDIYAQWEAELQSKRPYKIVCGQTIEIPHDKPWDQPRSQLGKSEKLP